MLQISPDEDERAGGYGFLVLPPESFDAERTVTVEILETFGGRWLGRSPGDRVTTAIGDANWQTVPHGFGPYPVQIVDGQARVRIGPEIVNKIPEYTHCRIKVGHVTAEVIWPDNLVPRPVAAACGGIRPINRQQPAPEPVPELTSLSVVDAEPAVPPAEYMTEVPKGGRGGVLMLAAVLLLFALVAGWVWLQQKHGVQPPAAAEAVPAADAPATPDPTPVAPVADAAPAAPDACSLDSITVGAVGFADIHARLGACSGQLSPEAAFDLLEAARSDGDGTALMLFGNLYDPAINDLVLETGFGLGVQANLALAAEYYSQAKARGIPAATEALTAACAALAVDASTIAQGAHNDFCR